MSQRTEMFCEFWRSLILFSVEGDWTVVSPINSGLLKLLLTFDAVNTKFIVTPEDLWRIMTIFAWINENLECGERKQNFQPVKSAKCLKNWVNRKWKIFEGLGSFRSWGFRESRFFTVAKTFCDTFVNILWSVSTRQLWKMVKITLNGVWMCFICFFHEDFSWKSQFYCNFWRKNPTFVSIFTGDQLQ